MAENDVQAAEPAKGKSKLKLIIIIVVGLLLATGLALGGYLWLLSGDENAEEGAETEEPFQPSQYYSLSDPFIVTITDKPTEAESEPDRRRKQHHMQIFAALQSRDAAALAAAETHSPLLRSRLRTLFGSQDFSEMQGLEGKRNLAKDAAETVNAVLSSEGAPPIGRVLFTNFVLQ